MISENAALRTPVAIKMILFMIVSSKSVKYNFFYFSL